MKSRSQVPSAVASGPENLQRRAHFGRSVDRERNQMGLRIVSLGQLAVRVRAARVEVPQYGETASLGGASIDQNLLAGQLRAAIRPLMDFAPWSPRSATVGMP